jgi:hypothetical protein
MTSHDYGFSVKLDQDVGRHHGRWMWRIEVRDPDTMAAPWFTHGNLSVILGTDSHDPAIVSRLVQWRRDESRIASASRRWSIGRTSWASDQKVPQRLAVYATLKAHEATT